MHNFPCRAEKLFNAQGCSYIFSTLPTPPLLSCADGKLDLAMPERKLLKQILLNMTVSSRGGCLCGSLASRQSQTAIQRRRECCQTSPGMWNLERSARDRPECFLRHIHRQATPQGRLAAQTAAPLQADPRRYLQAAVGPMHRPECPAPVSIRRAAIEASLPAWTAAG